MNEDEEEEEKEEKGCGGECGGCEGEEKKKVAAPEYDFGPTWVYGREVNSTFHTLLQSDTTDRLNDCGCRPTD